MTLAEFVLARIADREAAAQAVLDRVGSTRRGEPYDDGSGIAEIDDFPSGPWDLQQVELDHIGLNEPRNVLARCAVDRQIVAEHQQVTFTDVKLGLKDVPVCAKCHSVPDWIIAWEDGWTPPFIQDAWPCRTMLLLASLDAGHPDYDESWAASCSA